jgi:nicotinate phosphoribosyltransferase
MPGHQRTASRPPPGYDQEGGPLRIRRVSVRLTGTAGNRHTPLEATITSSPSHTPSTALLTDHYELTMLDVARQAGAADRRCVFEMFARSLPEGRRYGVVMGVQRALDALAQFRFGDRELTYLRDHDVVHADTLDWLADHPFTWDVTAFPDGEVYVPDEPVLTVEAAFGEAVILETLLLSILNHDAAIGATASRIIGAAAGRGLLEFGSRRTHEHAAVAAGAVAVQLGFTGTSNLEAGARHGVATLGTSAHAFTLLFASEEEAFRAQVDALGPGTTLLIDTYDITQGIERAVKAAGTSLGAIRIDSGDLFEEAVKARRQLDALGATDTRIVVSSDLDEYAIADLADAPVDAYGVGTKLVTGSGAPTAGFVYKLVSRDLGAGLEPVAKDSPDKQTRGGRKYAWRCLDDGVATHDVVTTDEETVPGARTLQVEVMRAGARIEDPRTPTPADQLQMALHQLPSVAHDLSDGPPCLQVVHR